jgi:hypothetical protein
MNFIPINWELIGNPYNWLVVVLMIALAGLALAAIFPQVAQGPS